MALVLRKTITPKNVFLLKCMKGRKLSTAVYKKNTAPFSSAAERHGHRRQRLSSNALKLRKVKCSRISPRNIIYRALFSRRSCPNIHIKEAVLQNRTFSTTRLSHPTHQWHSLISKREYSKACCACCPCKPCCPPSKGCECLPPPCDTPPRCLQYMSGYYYYPYGNWFCGPYHVSATCACVDGKCLSPCPCPKCCATCICTVPNTGNAEDKSKKLKESKVAAQSPCQTLIDMKFCDLKKTDSKKQTVSKKPLPSIFTSLIPTNPSLSPHCSVDRKSQRRYPILYTKFKRGFHTQAKILNRDPLNISAGPHEMDSVLYKSADQSLKDMVDLRSGNHIRHFSKPNFRYSRHKKYEKINHRLLFNADFKPFEHLYS